MTTFTRRAITASTLALAAGCASGAATTAPPATAPRGRAAIGAFGIDMTAIDPNVKPGDDFFQYVNGTWLNDPANAVPDDRTSWGTNDILIVKAERDVRTIIEEAAAAGGAPGSNRQKLADYYNAFLDQDAIDARGLEPLQPALSQIAALRTHEDVVRFVGTPGNGVSFPLVISIQLDEGNPDRYISQLGHGGLGLPEREYYRRTDRQFPELRTGYETACANMLGLVGQTGGAAKARAIMALETQIAELHWPIADRRERERTYNLMTIAQVRALAPRFPWDAYFDARGLGAQTEIVVAELSAIGPLANLVRETPVETWKSYLANSTAPSANATAGSAPFSPPTARSAKPSANFTLRATSRRRRRRKRSNWSKTCAAPTAIVSIAQPGCRRKRKSSPARSSPPSGPRSATPIAGRITQDTTSAPATRLAISCALPSGTGTTTSIGSAAQATAKNGS
jgi:putative endopeptidase